MLRRGVRRVVAVDVGHDQLVPELQDNPNVFSIEGFNARDLSFENLSNIIGTNVDENYFQLVVADVSFISLTLVLPAMTAVAPKADFVLLIKPQFEVGKESLHASGIVNDHRLRAEAIKQVADCVEELGFGIHEIVRSELPGTHGNIEYVLWISAAQAKNRSQWNSKIEQLAKEGK
jgi:23S rRNA (cytidine1920-2'-O)/16S rRNA (cytidine1409-2'-O)-methyltransferase